MAIERAPLSAVIRIRLPAELGGDHDLVAERSEAFADEFFVDERSIDLSGVEESDAAVDASMKKLDHLLLVFRRTKTKAHAHAAEADFRNLKTAFAQFAFLHSRFPFACSWSIGSRLDSRKCTPVPCLETQKHFGAHFFENFGNF